MSKTVAEKMRELDATKNPCVAVWVARLLDFEQETLDRCAGRACAECKREHYDKLADAIEAEQAELRERVDECNNTFIDLAALDLLCDKLECGDANHRATAEQIRKAMNGAKPQLPEGIQWPRFENGELVKFSDEYVNADGNTSEVRFMCIKAEGFKIGRGQSRNRWQKWGEPVKRPEPEILDADGVPIKVGDTVYLNSRVPSEARTVKSIVKGLEQWHVWFEEVYTWAYPSSLTHRKPDTRESVRAEIVEAVKADYAVNLMPLFDRYEAAVLRELGGE